MQIVAFILFFAAFYFGVINWTMAQYVRLRARRLLNENNNAIQIPASSRATQARGPQFFKKLAHRSPHPSLAQLMASVLDTIERNVHLGNSLRGATSVALESVDEALRPHLQTLALHCRLGAPLEELVTDEALADTPHDIAFGLYALVAAGAGGTGTSHALQRASWVLRERHAVREERRVQCAQALFSARILSWLPVAFGGVMLATNASVRNVVLTTPMGLFCVVIGVVFNVAGRRWMKHVARVSTARDSSESLVEFVDLVVVLLKSGRTTHQSLQSLAQWGPPIVRNAANAIVGRQATGERLVDALPLLHQHLGIAGIGVANTLAAGERDGLPLAPMLERLAQEAHTERRRAAQVDTAKIPVRLAFPLVFCILPSFVALTIVPILVGALSSLTVKPIQL